MAGTNEAKVVEAARHVFLRYGYKRVTMGDIAEAARMSRPALYLVFPSKEEIFSALLTRVFAAMLDEVRGGLAGFSTPAEKLIFAFDVWAVGPFETVLASPDAKDLYESSYRFATEVTVKANGDFASILAEVLQPLVLGQAGLGLSSTQIAQVLTSAVPGFKNSVVNAQQLRKLIGALIKVVLASLGGAEKTLKQRKRSTERRKA